MDKFEYYWECVRSNYMPGDISGYDEKENKSKYTYEEIMSMGVEGLTEKIGLSVKSAEYIVRMKGEIDIDREYERFLQSGVSVATLRDEEYPMRLKEIENRPYALFYMGELPSDNKRSVALIGARECSEYGRYMAECISEGLAKRGVDVISGMAYGIDGISQARAISSGGRSYAVLGSGVDICYPRGNRMLYDRLKAEGGIISEYPIGRPARAENFPPRNRIISGLSDIVVVVEAKLKSGTFITVDYALSQGREIMVVPGRATDPLSVGCNALLFQGAFPAQSFGDVIRLLDTLPIDYYLHKESKNEFRTKQLDKYVKAPKEKIVLEREENLVYSVLDFYALCPEEISGKSGIDIFRVMNILIGLEMKGLIKEVGKNLYVKCRK